MFVFACHLFINSLLVPLCSMQNLSSLNQGSNSSLLQWKHGILTKGPSEQSKKIFLSGTLIKLILLLLLLFSHSAMSYSLWPHGLQPARLPCLSLSPGVCSNSCPWSQWCHPTISSSVAPFSLCPQSFLASESFPIVSSSHQITKVLDLQFQYQSFQSMSRVDFL